MKIVCFNANGIRARLHQLEAIIQKYQPEIIGLQETKVVDDAFPFKAIEALGYHAEIFGQKAHYGVALLSKQAPQMVVKSLPAEDEQAQKRFIEARYATPGGKTLRVFNGYFPQGSDRKHPLKFPYKQRFYAQLSQYLQDDCRPDEPLVVMGDFNIAPQDLDIGIGETNAKRWLKTGKCSFLPEERDWFGELMNWGLYDSYRHLNPQSDELFSWFDYRSRGFNTEPKRGLRIDFILTTKNLTEHVSQAGIDYQIRGMEKPSDHAPVWLELKDF